MPKISFSKKTETLEIPSGSNLMESLNDAGIPVASSCGGNGVCVKCLVRVVRGKENLSPETDLEIDMRDIHEYEKGKRLSCQVQVLGDIEIDAEYW